MKINYIDRNHLLPRWRYQNHHLFETVLKQSNLVQCQNDGALNFIANVPGFKDLKLPKKPGELCAEAQHSKDEGSKKAYAIVIRMTEASKQTANGYFSDVDISLSQYSGSTIVSPRKGKMRRKRSVVQSKLS
eukprot:snap_masked-scaffold_6-processed-gene-14.26-mRNA-1 protein AED:1.00 eAED:1.00 QI:0/0/0/0/1/1/2/0/131